MGRLQSIERTNIRHAWNQLFKTSGFYRTLFFLHKISKAYHKPRFQMYADVRPSQDNRVRDILAYSILLEKYAQKIFRIKLSII